MASPAEINQNLPDTLPADFGDWDGEESPAVGTVDSPKAGSPKSESGNQGPRAASSRDSAARQFAPTEIAPKPTPTRDATARELAPRSIEIERNTAPIPRSPLGPPPPNPRAYATPSAKGPRAVPPASSQYPDDDVFSRRIRSLNTMVDKLPVAPQPREEMAAAPVVTLPVPPVIKEPKVETEEEPALSSRTDLVESEDEEERRAKRKWIAIIAVCVGVITLVVFQLFRYGTLSQVRHMVVAPSTTTVSSDALPDSITPDDASAARPLPGRPTAAASGERAPQTRQDDSSTSAVPAPVQSQMMHDQLLAPTRIPKGATTASSDAPPAEGFAGTNMAALGGTGANTSLFNGSSQSKTPAVTLKNVTVSAGVATGMLIHRTQPIYPSIAKAARITGTVVIDATISKTGAIVNPHVVSGPQMLRQAALDAVKTWRYRPYTLNNEPTDVETTVSIVFALAN